MYVESTQSKINVFIKSVQASSFFTLSTDDLYVTGSNGKPAAMAAAADDHFVSIHFGKGPPSSSLARLKDHHTGRKISLRNITKVFDKYELRQLPRAARYISIL